MSRRLVEYCTAHRALVFLVIFSLSFVVRFTLLVHYRGRIQTVGEAPRIAYALVSKGQFADPYIIPTGPTAHTTPFFPVVLAIVYKIFGTGFPGQFARCLMIISGYSLLYALYPIFASALGFPYEAGLFSGLACAVLPVRRSFEVFRSVEEPWAAIALGFLVIVSLQRFNLRRRDSRGAVRIGASWGAALYIGFAISAVMAGLLILDLLSHHTLRVLRDVCLIAITTLAVISPWVLRNHSQLHGWTLMRDNLGLELRCSNRDRAHASAETNGADPDADVFHPSFSTQEALLVRSMGEIAYNRREMHLAIDWVQEHPGNFARLTVQRFFYFWFGPVEHKFEFVVTSTCTILGLAGLGIMRKQVGEAQFRIWCTVLLSYPLLYYFIQSTLRYRAPIDWMIWLSAGLFVSRCWEGCLPKPKKLGI